MCASLSKNLNFSGIVLDINVLCTTIHFEVVVTHGHHLEKYLFALTQWVFPGAL